MVIDDVLSVVEERLKEAAGRGVALKVISHNFDDDWLYIVIAPAATGFRASDHARLMSDIEKELRQRHFDKVLLVPAIDDD